MAAVALPCGAAVRFDRAAYLDAMETAVGAYSDAHVMRYAEETEREGVQEHGFPRLTANLAVLVAHGRMTCRTAVLKRMMDVCFRDVGRKMPPKSGGNDFSVKELVLALQELERAGTFDKAVTDGWRRLMTAAVAARMYTVQPRVGNLKRAYNWSVFGAASEQARIFAGMGGDSEYVERYVSDQLRWFDANGMYRDPGQPMVYDMVTRLQFAAILRLGYDGPSRAALEAEFLKSAEPTFAMQSVAGEIPYGGRSNQFLHNETFYAALCEWYAAFFGTRGELSRAQRFRGAAKRAMASLAYWTDMKPIRHVKNRFPTETGYGCEKYAYFDKYMVTMASWAYLAYRFADDSIAADDASADSEFTTTEEFHRTMVNRGGYTVQWDWNAQAGYDANGVGRIQRRGAPPAICLSAPCPVNAHYRMDITNDIPFAIATADGKLVRPVRVDDGGVVFELKGKGRQTLMLPALVSDGESVSEIRKGERTLEVVFRGWICAYRTDGRIIDTGKTYGNRNGYYRRFDASGEGALRVAISIYPVGGQML